MNGFWKDEEVKSLFKIAGECGKSGKSLKEAFSSHAKLFKRSAGSVRNYYYKELASLEGNVKRRNRLGIDLKEHERNKIEHFSNDETKKCLEKINDLVRKGSSVRSACLTLAGGDKVKMLRLQNKYRTEMHKEKDKTPDNVIQFVKKSSTISDGELQALFAGLVRLVKRNALEEAEDKIREKQERANREFRKVLALLCEKEKELEKVKEDFSKIKHENDKLVLGERRNRCLKAEVMKRKMQLKNEDNA